MYRCTLGFLVFTASVWGTSQAWAQNGAIHVIPPTGTAKARNIAKVQASLEKSISVTEGLRLSSVMAGAECVIESSCLTSAGYDDGVTKIVGVHVSRDKGAFALLFVAADSQGQELGRHEVTGIKRKALERSSGPALLAFLASLPEQAPTTAEPNVAVDLLEQETQPEPQPNQGVLANAAQAQTVNALVQADNAPAPAETRAVPEAGNETPPAQDKASYLLEIGIGTGALFPQLASELGTTLGVELDLGVPVWKSASVLVATSYTQPKVQSSLSDPRIAGDSYSTSTTQRELAFTLGGTWRFLAPTSPWNIYAGMGARIWLLETQTNGEAAGMSFGENQETSTRFGGAGWAGGEFMVGPGAIAAELDIGGSDLPHLVTGDVATTAIALQVGYRLRL